MKMARLAPWLHRIGVVLVVVLVVGYGVGAFYFSEVLKNDLLTPLPNEPEFDLEVAAVGSGRIVLTRTDLTEQDGVWGVAGPGDAYGQAADIVEVRGDVVERSFRVLQGEFGPGDRAHIDQYAYSGDPATAHGITFEEVRIPSEFGVNPAWYIDGDLDTWVVIVHGKGLEERHQSLRILPALVEAGYPVLVITYRNDAAAAPNDAARYTWGREEWRDLEVAVQFGSNRGAENFVLYGNSMGGAIAAMFLHESDLIRLVSGVILDSPVLDLGAVVDAAAADRGIPAVLTATAKMISRLRFDLEWSELDHVARASEFDVPILLMHGAEDATVPITSSDEFAEARPDLVTYERFESADHMYLWNTDPERYTAAVLAFLRRVAPGTGPAS